MDRGKNGDSTGGLNGHNGAAFGLILGIVLGSLLLNVPGIATAGGLPERMRSAVHNLAHEIVQPAAPLAF